jgi:SAM-dependent methyltransferase
MDTNNNNPKRIVADGYDRIAEQHCIWASQVRIEERAKYTSTLLERLPKGADVLELGCGVGLPTTQKLAERFRVTGVDISKRHVTLARQNVPKAQFIQADMTQLDFAPASFDGIAAFYSIIHVPRDEQPELLKNIARWLREGGILVASMSAHSDEASVEDDWLGAPMYWSGFDSESNIKLLEDAGLEVVNASEETADESGEPITFLWVIAMKPVNHMRKHRS